MTYQPAPPLPARKPRPMVDVIAATMLTIGLLCVAAYSGFALTLGLAMSSDCGSGPNCTSTHDLTIALLLSLSLVLLSLVVGIGGLIFAGVKGRVLSWGPLAGYPFVAAAWLAAMAIAG